MFTGRRDALEASVDAVPASAQEVAALSVDRRVAQMRTLIEIAASKKGVAEAARRHDHGEAKRLLDVVADRIEHLLSGPERERETLYLDRLRAQLEERDFAMTSKSAFSQSYDREKGRHVDKLAAMHAAEFAWRSAKSGTPEQEGPAVTSPAKILHEYVHAVFTQGFRLPAMYGIHTGTTPWDATGSHLETLERCYASVLEVSSRLGVASLAIPSIGTGTHGTRWTRRRASRSERSRRG